VRTSARVEALSRPRQVTTKAAVNDSAGSNAALTACWSFVLSISFGSGSAGSTFPTGHGWVDASGKALLTARGVKACGLSPI